MGVLGGDEQARHWHAEFVVKKAQSSKFKAHDRRERRE
jgi:hypothetical protein